MIRKQWTMNNEVNDYADGIKSIMKFDCYTVECLDDGLYSVLFKRDRSIGRDWKRLVRLNRHSVHDYVYDLSVVRSEWIGAATNNINEGVVLK